MANVLQGLDTIQMLQICTEEAQLPISPHLMQWVYHTVVWSGQGQGTYNEFSDEHAGDRA